MTIFQDPAGYQRGIFEIPDSEAQINAFRNMVDDSVSDENLNTNGGVGLLERSDDGRQQSVGDAGRRSKP